MLKDSQTFRRASEEEDFDLYDSSTNIYTGEAVSGNDKGIIEVASRTEKPRLGKAKGQDVKGGTGEDVKFVNICDRPKLSQSK